MIYGPEVLALILVGYVMITSLSNYVELFTGEAVFVVSKIDKQKYLVRNLEDKDQAADKLAELKSKLVEFVSYMNKKNGNDHRVKRLVQKYQPDKISESSVNGKYTSYSVNKGEKIFMCVRQRDENDSLIETNTLLFVALHELAHIMTVSKGHTTEFWDNFKYILENSIECKLYKYQAFHKNPVQYCGTTIKDTPHKI